MTSATAARGREASSDFVERLRPLLGGAHRLAYGMLQGSHEAEDAVQEAIFKAWRARDRVRPDADLKPWFLKIVANECRQRMRRRWWSVLKRDEMPVQAAPDPTAGWGDASDLRGALRRLPHDQRLVLALRYYLDLPLDEVAAALGISPGAARARVHRALGKLRMEVPKQ
jgi:RNA polymerase sigma-70 factor (sigma-E family)